MPIVSVCAARDYDVAQVMDFLPKALVESEQLADHFQR